MRMSIFKIYRNAYRYVMSHLFGFAFLTVFYFLGNLFPIWFGTTPFKLLSVINTYIFFYFAAGFYYRQQFLWDRKVFIATTLRFIAVCLLFLSSIFISSLLINFGIWMINQVFGIGGEFFVKRILGSILWYLLKYVFLFGLFILFFVVPSFSFISEISEKNRSILATYVKTRGNLRRIAALSGIAFIALLIFMIILTFVPVYIAAIPRAAALAFFSICYFKMYDFFYCFPTKGKSSKKTTKVKTEK